MAGGIWVDIDRPRPDDCRPFGLHHKVSVKVLQIFNQYRSAFTGEEIVIHQTIQLLRDNGIETQLCLRTSRGIGGNFTDKARVFFRGIYSPDARRAMLQLLKSERPDIVHAHNLYPLFSPSILLACRQLHVPVVMSLHNYQLTCPRSDHLYKGRVCERCTSWGAELNCVALNCRENFWESTGYAVRHAVARKLNLFRANVTCFVALNKFARNRLTQNGFEADQIEVLPNMVSTNAPPSDPGHGQYIAFAGRMSEEKGLETLLAAATQTPWIRYRLAGTGPLVEKLRRSAAANIRFCGRLSATEMASFYRKAQFLVFPSSWLEMCPLVVLEAMSHGLPVVASRIGGLNELVEDGETGFLFRPGDATDLARKIELLRKDVPLARRMGHAGYERVKRKHNATSYFKRLRQIYIKAIDSSAS